MATTNLPPQSVSDSAAGTKLFFNSYGQEPYEFSANEVNAAVSFFKGKGFDDDASLVVSTVILTQAKLDNEPVFVILDTLGQLEAIELSQVVGEILNNNRTSTSSLGFRIESVTTDKVRSILP